MKSTICAFPAKHNWRTILASAMLVFLCPEGSAQGYINTGSSVEWLCLFKPVVVLAKVTSVSDRERLGKDADAFETANVTCVPLEFLKGKSAAALKEVRFKFEGFGPAGDKGTQFLLFLDTTEEKPDILQVVYWINLDQPATELSRGVCYTKAGEVLRKGDDILKLARSCLQVPLPQTRPSEAFYRWAPTLYIEAPAESSHALDAGSACYLNVPPDVEFKTEFLKRYRVAKENHLKDVNDTFDDRRFVAAMLPLAYYAAGDAEVLAEIKECLKDPSHCRYKLQSDPEIHFQGRVVDVYFARQLAYFVLVYAGQAPDKPEGFCDWLVNDARGSGSFIGFHDPVTGRSIAFEEIANPSPTTQ